MSEISIGKPGPLCVKCPLRDQPYIDGRLKDGGVLVVGECPGQTDVETGRLFSGLTGERLRKLLSEAGLTLDDCSLATVVRCHVSKTRMPPKRSIECCQPLLMETLRSTKPDTVITLGEIALSHFHHGKLRSYHGTKIDLGDYMLVPMYKPDAFDKNPDLLPVIASDFAGLQHRKAVTFIEGHHTDEHSARAVPKFRRAALDTETTGKEWSDHIIGLAVSAEPGTAHYFHGELLMRYMQNRYPSEVIMHNAKFDLQMLERRGIPMSIFDSIDDSMILAYCMNKPNLALKDLVVQELQLDMLRFEEVALKGKTLVGVPSERVAVYCGSDADGTLRLYDYLWNEADSREKQLYLGIEKPLIPIVAQMELRGAYVDVPYLYTLQKEMQKTLDGLLSEMNRKHSLTRQMLMSPVQLRAYLYEDLKLPIGRWTDTGGPSTEHGALERLAGMHPALDLILQFRKVSKLKSAFVDGLIEANVDGVVHPGWNQIGTATGRMSSSGPNMQQLPKRDDKTIRRAFTAPEGYAVVSLDNSQIDLRTLAYVSGDPLMNKIFAEDGDIHIKTAKAVFGSDTEENRSRAKTLNFLTVYGGGVKAFAAKAGIPEATAQRFVDEYWRRYAGVKRWADKLHVEVVRTGYTETPFGRRRYIPKVFTHQKWAALREAQNAPIQGGSADVIKLQMVAAADIAIPFAQIHDELDFYLPIENLNETINEIKWRMEDIDCPFKLKVEVKVGPNLGDLEDWMG